MKIKWIDFSKGIAILLVVIGHSFEETKSGHYPRLIIYSFHIPFFFFIAGYLFGNSDTKKFIQYSSGKFKRLLAPYFLAGAFIYLYMFIQNINDPDWSAPGVALRFLIAAAFGNGNYDRQLPFVLSVWQLWFLPALFLSNIIFWIIIKFFNRKIYRFIMFMALGSAGILIGRYIHLPWSLDIVLATLPLMYAGYIFRKKDLSKYFSSFNLKLIIPVFALWIFDIYSGGISLNNREYNNFLISYPGAIAGCILLLYASYWLSKLNYLNIPISFVGAYTIVILCFHNIDAFWADIPEIAWIYTSWFYLAIFKLAISLGIILLIKNLSLIEKIFSGQRQIGTKASPPIAETVPLFVPPTLSKQVNSVDI
jgi:fucose 4-O-acetylase-like acetyltransferase